MSVMRGHSAVIACSFNTAYHRHALIAGTEGILETTFLNNPSDGGAPEIHLRRGVPSTTPRETISCAGGSGFLAEAESHGRAVALGRKHWNGRKEAESVDTISTLEAIARSTHRQLGERVSTRRIRNGFGCEPAAVCPTPKWP
jgi:D-xylose 1-dehydrogenase (NADP+, D-xylono-1,5-lactone-forming)